MRIFTNERFLKRNRQMATLLFFVSLAILVGGLILTNTAPRGNTALIFLPLLAMPVGLVTTWISVRLTNLYVREPHAEIAVQAALKAVSNRSVLYNYLFKAAHVLVSPQGVYAIVTRFQDGTFTVKGDHIQTRRARGPLGAVLVVMRQEQMGSPVKDARNAAIDLQKRLDAALPNSGIVVQPVVVFISPRAEIEDQGASLPVVVANPKSTHSKTLKVVLRDSKKSKETALTVAQIDQVESALNEALGIGESQSQVVAGE